VLLISTGLHWYVFTNLRRILLRDYPKIGKSLAKIALWAFIGLDSPFLFLYIRGFIHAEMTELTRVLLYPFLVWQTIMLMWVIILFPITIWRMFRKLAVKIRITFGSLPNHGSGVKEKIGLEVAAEQ
jgi:hypothetical protein